MSSAPVALTLEVLPRARVDAIDITSRVAAADGDLLRRYSRALYFSYHTTAGYLEPGLAARLRRGRSGLGPYLELFRTLFPPDADYQHDQLHLRAELSAEQRRSEPRNADSHLAFIGSGLRSCVTTANAPERPVFLIDLDGVTAGGQRRRRTTVVAFHRERLVERLRLEVPVSAHPIDSVNLRDPRLGLYEELGALVARAGVAKGRIRVALAAGERQAGLTVNEYETLLMRHDLAEVLRNPLRFMAEKGRHMLQDPRAIPAKTIEYAKYDLVRVVNRLLDALGMSESMVEQAVARFMAFPASRFLRMKRAVHLLVADEADGQAAIRQGPYQSPILVQWNKATGGSRQLDVTLTEFS